MHSYVELLEYSFLDYPSIPKKQPKDFDLQEGTASKRAVTRLHEKSVAETGWKQDVSNSQQSHGWRFWLVPVGAKDLSASLVREAYRVTGVKQNPGEIKGDPSVNGRIHSIESFGTVDGPGIRCVVFLQGCSLRCRYCHNPDTWDRQGGQEIDAEEVVQKVLRFKSYFGEKGGITLSGGEPLLQPDFVADILKKCKQEGIHTAVDTSGCVDIDALEKVLPYTDLLLLDIKGLNEEDYAWITGQRIEKYREALQVIQKWKTNLWLRYVVLPGINDSQRHRERLKEFVRNLSSQVQNVELLPYHPLGVHKWERLGLKYTLSDLQTPNQAEMDQLTQEIGKFLRK